MADTVNLVLYPQVQNGAEVAAVVAGQAFDYLDAPIMRVCGPDVPTMPFALNLEEAYMPGTEKISAALKKLAAY